MTAELLSLPKAVGRFVSNGCHLTIGGFTVSRNPMAAIQEIIRKGRKHLHLSLPSLGPAFDLLVGAGCVEVDNTGGVSGIRITSPTGSKCS